MCVRSVSWFRIMCLVALGWACYTVALVWGSLAPVSLHTGIDNGDKILHFMGYGGLAVGVPWMLAGRRWLMTWIGLTGIGVALELAQWALPTGRSGDWHDGVANAAGVTLGLLLRYLFRNRLQRQGGEA